MKCTGCLWAADCGGGKRCKDYAPLDDTLDVAGYEQGLRDRVEDAADLAAEFSDGNWKEDEWLERECD